MKAIVSFIICQFFRPIFARIIPTPLKHIYISEIVITVDGEDHLPRTNMLKCDRVSEWYLYLFDQQKCIYFLNENMFDNIIISPS